MTLLTPDSPLVALPANLKREQAMFLDGMRYSIEMADLAHERLRSALVSIAGRHHAGREYSDLVPFALLDAWSIVDNLHRFRELLQQMPGIKQLSPDVQLFLRASSGVEGVRHSIQHLRSEIRQLSAVDHTVWGVIHWFMLLEVADGRGRGEAYALIAGSVRTAQLGPVETQRRPVQAPIDLITLNAHGNSVCLSDLWMELARYVTGFEAVLRPQFAGQPQGKRDLLAVWNIEFPGGVEEVSPPSGSAP